MPILGILMPILGMIRLAARDARGDSATGAPAVQPANCRPNRRGIGVELEWN